MGVRPDPGKNQRTAMLEEGGILERLDLDGCSAGQLGDSQPINSGEEQSLLPRRGGESSYKSSGDACGMAVRKAYLFEYY